MEYSLRSIFGLLAAMLVISLAPLSHAAAAITPSMGGMAHEPVAGSCALACSTVAGVRHDEQPVLADEDDDDELQPPFYVALQSAWPVQAVPSPHERFVRKPPPKVPLYLQYVQLRLAIV